MEALILVLLATGLLVALGVLAARFGADSRESIADDRTRPAWR